MPHRNFHREQGETSKAGLHRSSRRHIVTADEEVGKETMSREFPSYNALKEHGSDSLRGEHRADTSRMRRGMRGYYGASASRSPDIDEEAQPARGESTFGDDSILNEEQPARGESSGRYDADGSLWGEGESPGRGESGPPDSGLTWSGFPRASRGESDGSETQASERVQRSAPSSRGESLGGGGESSAHGGFIEPDERSSGSSRRH
jgi:hypothetical protein